MQSNKAPCIDYFIYIGIIFSPIGIGLKVFLRNREINYQI